MTDDLILDSYVDALGERRTAPGWAVDHVRDVLAEPRPGRYSDVLRVRAGEPAGAAAGRTLRTEDGGTVRIGDTAPEDLPIGYHQIDGDDGQILVLAAPGRVPGVDGGRGWVLAAQLYAARSRSSWGHGDLADARTLLRWAAEAGPGAHVMLNPLHAPLPGPHPQPSPYFASSRTFRNPIYISVDELAATDPRHRGDPVRAADLAALAAAARAADGTGSIDRAGAWAAKRAALALLWESQRTDPATAARVDRWLEDPIQRRYARFASRTEAADGTPPAPGVDEPRPDETPDDDERFQAWLQIVLADQLVALDGALVLDVAVGTDRAGADAWLWPGCFVLDGTRIGCPPDQFNTLGQDWGLPPMHPLGLRAAGHEPFVRAIGSALTGASGIRIDHVMGLERLFWIPEEGSPPDGVYVRYPLQELLDVVAIEAHRAGAFVVGEDLGTVPPGIRESMALRGMLSYRIASLDPTHPNDFPTDTMAAVTTHDLATAVGLLTGSDLEDQTGLDLHPNEADTRGAVERLRYWTGSDATTPIPEQVERIHRLVARSPARLSAVTLDDLAGATRRPNMPGTIDSWPNWSIALPRPLDDVLTDPFAVSLRDAAAGRDRP